MKKSLSFLMLASTLFVGTAMGQSLDRENLPAVKYVRLPLEPLDTAVVKTFKVNVTTSDNNPYTRDLVVGRVVLDGFKSVREGDTDLTINVEVYPIVHSEPSLQTKQTTTKKDGVEKTVTTYYYTSTFTSKVTLRLQKATGEELFATESADKTSVSGQDASTSKDAYNAYTPAREESAKKAVEDHLARLKYSINSKYGYTVIPANMMAFKVKAKKFPYDDFNAAYPKFEAAIGLYNPKNGLSAENQKMVSDGIDALQKEIAQYEPENKKARVDKDVASAAYYNVSVGYFLLRKYDDAINALAKAEEIRKGIGWADAMSSLYTDMSKRTKANTK